MGLLSIFTLALPLFLSANSTSQSEDLEKSNKKECQGLERRNNGLHDLEHDSGDDGDVLEDSHHSPRRGIDRPAGGDDIRLPGTSIYSRLKSYLWPTDDKNADLDSLVPNYRWTPIISGVVIPFSILLEIPGLTERWYIRTENHQTVEIRKNPVILEVGLAISIACGLIANVALVLRFLEKRVQTVTLICIIFLTVHDVINIVTVTVFGVEHRFDDGFTYGEAFWMTLCSTIASTITNISLIVDFVRTPDFSRRGSGLTRKQRALMIIVIVLLVYIAFGALVNSILLHQSFINGLYFSVVSIETIGFGDIVPRTTGARVWTCLYILFGVINIGVAIAMCRETILEGLEIGYRRRLRDMRQRRREARRFRRWEARWQRAVEFRLREAGLPVHISDNDDLDDGHGVRFLGLLPHVTSRVPFLRRVGTTIKRTATFNSVDGRFANHHKTHLNVNALTNAQLEAAALEAGVPLEMFLDLGERRGGGREPEEQTVNGLPIHRDEHNDVVPTLAQAHATHAYRENMTSGWPSHAQTPTHAQVGRMAAMVTKFAVAVAGRHAHASEPSSDMADFDTQDIGRHPAQQPGPSGSGMEGIDDEHVRKNSLLDSVSHCRLLKDRSRGASQRSAWSYEKLQTELDAEEKRAYFVKLFIAWMLFFVFWTVGSGIFSATEGWPYGSAMYFCFLAFVTTGYGDFAPVTPAGRSVFVVWALFGVGTLTIVVSVIQEAGSSRYKNALHSHVFDKAVKKYRKRQLQEGKQRPRPVMSGERSSSHRQEVPRANGVLDAHLCHGSDDARTVSEQLQKSQEIAQRALEALPGEIVRGARIFEEYIHFFVSGAADGASPFEDRANDDTHGMTNIPPDMRKLLDELAEIENINERDVDARKVGSLKKMVTSAEKALSALADREALASLATAEPSGVAQTPTANTNKLGGNDSASSSGLIPTQLAPSPLVHQRRAQHKHTAVAVEVDGASSASDREDVSSTSSSTTTGPLTK
ncbi:hypothetical protein BC628DRAFT_1409942 [Trametes gibbosa]|nr:hypothetical protein BC628DRAFT_1409942 [Trametes gibbosa]